MVERMATSTPALLSAFELALAYGHEHLLKAVTLSVSPGEKVGLVGRNGCGTASGWPMWSTNPPVIRLRGSSCNTDEGMHSAALSEGLGKPRKATNADRDNC